MQFESKSDADEALKRTSGIEFFGKKLYGERSKRSYVDRRDTSNSYRYKISKNPLTNSEKINFLGGQITTARSTQEGSHTADPVTADTHPDLQADSTVPSTTKTTLLPSKQNLTPLATEETENATATAETENETGATSGAVLAATRKSGSGDTGAGRRARAGATLQNDTENRVPRNEWTLTLCTKSSSTGRSGTRADCTSEEWNSVSAGDS